MAAKLRKLDRPLMQQAVIMMELMGQPVSLRGPGNEVGSSYL